MMTLLAEDNHPLITPQFAGTAEEITTALRCWADLIENFRFLDVRVTAYDNRSKIIEHLKRELEALEAELDNKSATMTGGDVGQMKQAIDGSGAVDQPLPASAAPVQPEPISLAPTAADAAAAHAARYAPPVPTQPNKLGSMIANFNAAR